MVDSPEVFDLLARLRAGFASLDHGPLAATLAEAHSQELVEIWSEISDEERDLVLRLLAPEKAAEVFANLSQDQQPEAIDALPLHRLAEVFEELSPDDLADALQTLGARDAAQVEEVRSLLDPETLAVADSLTGYHDQEAGGIMTPEFLSVRASMTAEEVLSFLRRTHPDAESIYYTYVVDEADRLRGVISLRDLIVCAPHETIATIMRPNVVSVRTDMDQEKVAALMSDYDFTVLPVVDAAGKLVGIVTVDDVLDVVQEEATEDIHRMGGAPVGIDYVHANPWLLFRKRASWLILLVVSMTLTYNVIARYERIIQEVVILAAFIPLLIGTGGNVGAQAATLVVRALATRELELRDYFGVLRKELGTGILLGVAFGTFMTGYVLLFHAEPRIAIALGVTMVLISITANLVGASMPFLFQRLGLDPALASSPGVTTVMDVLGLLIYFRVVIWIMGPILEGGL